MFGGLRYLFRWVLSALGSRKDLVLENLAFREPLLVLHTRRPRRRLSARHKLFWVALSGLWSGWQKPLVLVRPRTVIAWHQAGFRLYWKWLSRTQRTGGRRPTRREIRELTYRMAAENPTWGVQRIHGELLVLGFKVSEPTVSRWRQVPRNPDLGNRWIGRFVYQVATHEMFGVFSPDRFA
jgi:putative transposase